MRLTKCSMLNFQSYPELEFDFSNLGLCLISGATKAGKSSLMDAACWTLFGTTSKDSAADDVRAWYAEGAPTVGKVEVEMPGGSVLQVTRVRGKRASDNDLYYLVGQGSEPGSTEIRGKDANDTQRQIEERLGVDAELYISGSYLHQFSKADQFFTAKAKDRRETLERVADLSLPIRLGERASEARKQTKKDLDAALSEESRLTGRYESLTQTLAETHDRHEAWASQKEARISALITRRDGYQLERDAKVAKIVDAIEALDCLVENPEELDNRYQAISRQLVQLEAIAKDVSALSAKKAGADSDIKALRAEYDRLNKLGDVCPTCLGPAHSEARAERMAQIEFDLGETLSAVDDLVANLSRLNKALEARPKLQLAAQEALQIISNNRRQLERVESERAKLEIIKAERNPYDDQIARAEKETNPFVDQLVKQTEEVKKLHDEVGRVEAKVGALNDRLSALTWLYDKSFELRGRLLERAVMQIQDATNGYLERFFDAEIRVSFSLKDADKLDVSLTNEGYDCPYRQLSGGERALLKLCFSVSYMRAAEDMAGVKFNCLMLDEALHGLDASLKVRAFNLLQSLENSYESVLVIDHSEELKSQFQRRFLVTKVGAHSEIAEAK